MSTHHPVEVTRAQGTKAEGLDVKRFYLPGCTLTSKCPKCGKTATNDMADTYLSYPSLDEPTEVAFGCDDCDDTWEGLVQVSVEIKPVTPEQTGGES